MFVRRQHNKSGSFSIYVVDKSRGRYDIVKSFGSARTKAEADLLENKAREWVREQEGDPETLFDQMDEAQLREYAATMDEGRLELAGPELYYGEVFDLLGLGKGMDPLFRHLVLCRLYAPGSAWKVCDYLRRYLGTCPERPDVYRAIDGFNLSSCVAAAGVPAICYVLSTAIPKLPFCLLLSADGTPLAGRLIERKDALAKHNQAIQRFSRKHGATEPVVIVRRGVDARALAAFFKQGKKDLSFKPQLRRPKGRVEGLLCVSLAAYAVQFALDRLLRSSGASITLPQIREAARTLFRLNYISPYTRRPKSVLIQMTPLQKQLFDLLHS